tara:strand:+ start:3576 stop:3788 length:213 start_codon:yes stop_codon:yes gene_type:complete
MNWKVWFVFKQYSYRWCIIIFILTALRRPDKGNQKSSRHQQTASDQNEYYAHDMRARLSSIHDEQHEPIQ